MPAWEYNLANVDLDIERKTYTFTVEGQVIDSMQEGLQILGTQGWELVGIHANSITAASEDHGNGDSMVGNFSAFYIFKRPVQASLEAKAGVR
jgi:hypothetical protein